MLQRALYWGGVGSAGVLGAACAGTAALYAADRPMFEASVRVGRCAAVALTIVLDYRLAASAEPAAAAAALAAAHERSGERLRSLCETNAGLYVKIGQHLALLDYLVPEAYLRKLRPLFDCAPRTPWPTVRAMIELELGAPVESLFAQIEHEPIASASLAQVHRARGHDGADLAVKVQHPNLALMARTEIALLALVVRAVRWLEPSFGFEWLVEEVQLNLPLELDFRNEAENSRRCAAALAARFGDTVVVPAMHPALSTARILTMDFESGVHATDGALMRELGLEPRAVARLLGEIWGEMCFGSGWVHCDPHPGNVLVRARRQAGRGGGRAEPQVVLLDHGLYRQLSAELRDSWAELWAAVVLSDVEEIRRVCDALGVRSSRMEAMGTGLSFTLLAAMLTARPYRAVTEGSLDALDARVLSTDATERAALAADVSSYSVAIIQVLETLPRPLLLLLKTNDALRSAGMRLDARPSDTYVVTALESLRSMRAQLWSRSGRWASASRTARWAQELKLLRARARIGAYLLSEWLGDALAAVRAAFGFGVAGRRAFGLVGETT